MNFDLKKIQPETGFYLAGFTDAEGSFFVSFSPKIDKNNDIYSWYVNPVFSVSQKERHIIAQFKKHLKCGTVNTNSKNGISTFTVTSLHAIRNHIVPFFKKFGFQSSKKKTDFSNFCKVLKILERDQLTKSNFQEILSLRVNTECIIAKRKYSDEKILSTLDTKIHINQLKKSSETNTPNSENTKNIPNEMIESDLYGDIKAKNALKFYIAGFVDGNGSFNVSFRIRNDYTIGWKINPSFSIAQRDQMVLKLFQKTLGCGRIRKGNIEGIYYFEVLDLTDLKSKIIPFFQEYTFLSEIGLEKFQRFCKTVDILSFPPDTKQRLLSRVDLTEILLLQRNQNRKTRYTSQQILDRFDQFSCKTKKF